MRYTLSEILDEIQVGSNQNDPQSNKLKGKIKELREIFAGHGVLYKMRNIDQSEVDIFIQGSYGIHTAIKHKTYEVDADLALIVEQTEPDYELRSRLYDALKIQFVNDKKVKVTFKKPCITIDFGDGYCIDIATYGSYRNIVGHYNCIDGVEKVTESDPKGLTEYFKDVLARESEKRKVIRLFKHFNKVTFNKLEIDECNKIPSIAITTYISENSFTSGNLDDLLIECVDGFRNYIYANKTSGPSLPRYKLGNTFHKVRDINEVYKQINHIHALVKQNHFSELLSENVLNQLSKKNDSYAKNPYVGTLG